MKFVIITVVFVLTGMVYFMSDSVLAISAAVLGDNVIESDRISSENCEQLTEQLSKQWEDTKGLLITSLGSDDQQVQFTAAFLLGLYRYAEATDSLANLIVMEDAGRNEKRQSRESLWGEYPAVEALIRIGKPSVSAMLRNLESSEDEHVRGLSARVIYYVEGPKLAKIVVENAVNEQKDPIKKKLLESSLPLVHGGEYVKPK